MTERRFVALRALACLMIADVELMIAITCETPRLLRPDKPPLGSIQMEQGTLEEVLEVEKEIEKLLDSETAKAQQWLERQKRKIEEERQSAITELEASVAHSKESARTSVEARASRIVDQAKAVACRVDAMGDDRLNQIVWRHLAIIMPESVRDR